MNISSIKSAFTPVKKAVGTVAGKVKPHLENIGADVYTAAANVEAKVKGFAEKPQVKTFIGNIADKAKAFAEKPQVKELFGKVKAFAEKPQVKKFAATVVEKFGAAKEFVKSLVGKIAK